MDSTFPFFKKCTTCKELFENSFFHKDKQRPDGLSGRCKKCEKERRKQKHAKNRDRDLSDGRQYYQTHKEKVVSRINKYRLTHSERLKEKRKEYYLKNRKAISDYHAAYRKMYGEKISIRQKKWREKNPEKFVRACAKSKARRLKATMSWANEFFIDEIYALAKLRTQLTGIKWHVDHIIPLQGKNVCGFHVESNLRVIPAILNMKKGNRHVP